MPLLHGGGATGVHMFASERRRESLAPQLPPRIFYYIMIEVQPPMSMRL